MRTATFQPSPIRLTSIKPQPTIRATCPTYIGDQRNERGLTIRDKINAALASPEGFAWHDADGNYGTVAAVRDFIDGIADPDGSLGLGVTVA